jgi:hypothetical protein
MKWCCDGIIHMFEQRYYRTIFVFAKPPSSTLNSATFWIGMRSVEHDKVEELRMLNIPRDIPITISTSFPISHCPWCGVNLSHYYRNSYSQLVDDEISNEFK